jgi:hypothetical protein
MELRTKNSRKNNKFKNMLGIFAVLLLLEGYMALNCGVVQRKSSLVDGIGAFAHRSFQKGEVIERCITAMLPTSRTQYNLLDEYVFGHLDSYSDVVLGYAMVYNHHANSTVVIQASNIPSPRAPENKFIKDFIVYAKRDIEIGEELYSSYGTEKWFEERNIPYVSMPPVNIPDISLGNLPGCPYGMTEVFGGRIFATQTIYEGEVIEVARGLIMPSELTDGTSLDDLVWKSPTQEGAVMILLGTGALFRGREDTEVSNVIYEWYDEHDNFSNGTPTECHEKMLVSFTAKRTIEVNEELIIDLYNDGSRFRIAELSGDCL